MKPLRMCPLCAPLCSAPTSVWSDGTELVNGSYIGLEYRGVVVTLCGLTTASVWSYAQRDVAICAFTLNEFLANGIRSVGLLAILDSSRCVLDW